MSSVSHKGNTYTSDSIFIACFWSFTISSFFYGFLNLCIRAQSVSLVLHDKTCILCTFLCAPGFVAVHMDYVTSDLEPWVSTIAIVFGVWPLVFILNSRITLHNPVIESCYVFITMKELFHWAHYTYFYHVYDQLRCFFIWKTSFKALHESKATSYQNNLNVWTNCKYQSICLKTPLVKSPLNCVAKTLPKVRPIFSQTQKVNNNGFNAKFVFL